MAAYDHLPIFKKMLELAVYVEHMALNFSRAHKYTLGGELRGLCHEGLALIAEANSSRDGRAGVLLRLRMNLERIKIHLMLAREVRAFHNKESFGRAARLVVDVSRQNEGWLKSAANSRQQEAPRA